MKKLGTSLVSRLIVAFLGLSLFTVILVGALSYSRARAMLIESVNARLNAILDVREESLNRWVQERISDLFFISKLPQVQLNGRTLIEEPGTDESGKAYVEVQTFFRILLADRADFSEILILARSGGEVVLSSDVASEGDFRVSDTYFTKGLGGAFIQNVYLSPTIYVPTMTLATPILDEGGRAIGVLAVHLDLQHFDEIILGVTGLGKTGEIYVVDSTNTFVSAKGFGRADYPRGAHSMGIEKAIAGKKGNGLYRNYAGTQVVGAYRWLPERNLALIGEISQSEAFQPARQLAIQIAFIGAFISLLLTGAVNFVARRIAGPVLAITEAARKISAGERDIQAPVLSDDEVGELARTFNRMVTDIRDSEEKFRNIFMTSPDSITITRVSDGVVVDVNAGFTALTGYDRTEILGKSILTLYGEEEDREPLIKMLSERGEAHNFEADFRIKDGTHRTGLSSARIITLGGEQFVLSITKDITEIKAAEEAVRVSEERFRTLFRTSPGAIVITRMSDHVIVDINEEYVGLTGISREKTIGRTAVELGLWKDEEIRSTVLEQLQKGERIDNLELTFEVHGGRIITGLLSANLVTLEDELHTIFTVKDVTRIKEAETRIRESEEKYRLLAENVSDVIWVWDENLKPVYYSPSILQLRGVTSVEAIQQSMEQFLTPASLKVAQELIARELQMETQEKGVPSSDVLTTELEMFRKDGSTIWTEVSMRILRNEDGKVTGVTGVTRNINRRKIAERALKESEERYRILFNSGSDAVFVHGITDDGTPGEFYTVNDVACQILGMSREELMEKTPADIVPAEAAKGIVERGREVLEKKRTVYESYLLDSRGNEIPVEMSISLIDLYDSPVAVSIARDLTERKKVEEEREKVQAKLIQANKMTSLGLMVSSLGHEINNPNNTIMFNLRRFAKTWDDIMPILDEYHTEHGDFNLGGMPYSELKDIFPMLVSGTLESSEMIKAIIENLKGFVRQSSDAMDFDVDVSDVVRRAVTLLESQVRKGVGRLETELEENLPRVKGNPQKLIQVMVNLISNALEALTDDEQRVLVVTGKALLGEEIFLEVLDQGVGMDPDQLGRIFEPFHSTKLETGGTGLGMTITKMLLDEHGARLDIESEPGLGTWIRVTFLVDEAIKGG